MKEPKAAELGRYRYTQQCKYCGAAITVLTQQDDEPEYRTQVYVQCQCGDYVEFNLPVN